MELDKKISEIFIAKDVENKPKDTNSQMELKKIEQQLNLHLKDKQGLKFKKVSLIYDKSYDAEKFGHVIDKELEEKTCNKKWKGLPMFMKWKLIELYLEKNNIIDKIYINMIRSKLSQNILEVKYEDKEVLSIV